MAGAEDWRTSRRVLVACGGAGAAGYLVLAWLPTSNRLEDVLAFLALCLVLAVLGALGVRAALGCPRRFVTVVGLVGAALFRLALLPAGLPTEGRAAALADDLGGETVAYEPFLLYDNDVWRYLWDGHVAVSGESPWRTVPADFDPDERVGPLADEVWRDVRSQTSFHHYRSVYPPFAQLLFATHVRLAAASVALWKLGLVVVDLGVVALLFGALARAGRPAAWALLYGWNPVVVKEIAGSGHVDGWLAAWALVTVVLLARGRAAGAGGAAAAAVLTKLAALPLAALFVGRDRRRGLALLLGLPVALVLLLPKDAGALFAGLRVYATEWRFNSGLWELFGGAASALGLPEPERVATALSAALVLGTAWCLRREIAGGPDDLPRAAFWLLAVTTLVSPAVMPWYLIWAAPLAALAGCISWFPITVLTLASYLTYAHLGEALWWRIPEHLAIAALLLWEARRRRPGFVA